MLLQDASPCHGLLDWALRAVLPAFPSAPIGNVFAVVNTAIGFVAIFLVARLLYRLTASMLIAAAITLALLATPVFTRSLAPAVSLAVLAVTAAGWLQLLTAAHQPSGRLKHMLLAGFFFALVPALAPAAVSACAADTPSAIGPAIRDAVSAFGPLPYALAALGLFAAWPELQRRESWLPALLAGVPLALALFVRGNAEGVAVLAAALWSLAAIGLSEIVRRAGTRAPERATVFALLALVFLLQFQRLTRADVSSLAVRDGHEAMTLAGVRRLVRLMPAVTIVDEDASTDLLFRAARVERLRKQLTVVRRERSALAAAAERGPLFALPRAQRDLQYRGVEFAADIGGSVARVQAVRNCATTAAEWQDVSAYVAGGRFALVAPVVDARGPVEMYVGSDVSLAARAAGWPPRDLRGFHVREYERARLPDLESVLRQRGIAAPSSLLTAPRVTHLELWRTPSAPNALPVALTGTPSAAVARAVGPGPALELCRWLEFTPTRIAH